jgi:hypothetical protein
MLNSCTTLKVMMSINQYGRPTPRLSSEDLKGRKEQVTREHRWGAGQSFSDAFVNNFSGNNMQVGNSV